MKKFVSLQQFDSHVDNITADKMEQAKLLGQPFNGVSSDELFEEIKERVGGDWVLKKEEPFKFTKDDINAVANSRFYRKVGLKILMLWAIVILVLIQAVYWLPSVPIYVYYALCLLATVGFLAWYTKKQRESRQSFWKEIEGNGAESE